MSVSQINYRSTGSTALTAANTQINVTKPSGLAVGDLMIAQIAWKSNGTISTALAGWNSIGATVGTGTARSQMLFWKIATSTETAASTFLFSTTASGTAYGAIHAFSGNFNASFPIDKSGGVSNAAGVFTAPTLTPSIPDEVIVLLAMSQNDDASPYSGYAIATSDPGSWSEIVDVANVTASVSLGAAYSLPRSQVTATGAGSVVFSVSRANVIHMISIRTPGQAFGQAQAKIKGIGVKGFGQAQATISRGTKNGFGQAQAWIRGPWSDVASGTDYFFGSTTGPFISNVNVIEGDIVAVSTYTFSPDDATVSDSDSNDYTTRLQTINIGSVARAKFFATQVKQANGSLNITVSNGGVQTTNFYILILHPTPGQGKRLEIISSDVSTGFSLPNGSSNPAFLSPLARFSYGWNSLISSTYTDDLSGSNASMFPNGLVSASDPNSYVQSRDTFAYSFGSRRVLSPSGNVNVTYIASNSNVSAAEGDVAYIVVHDFSAYSAQAQADIKATSTGFGQAQARVVSVGRGFAQAQAMVISIARLVQTKSVRIASTTSGTITLDNTPIAGNYLVVYSAFSNTSGPPTFASGQGGVTTWSLLSKGNGFNDYSVSRGFIDGTPSASLAFTASGSNDSYRFFVEEWSGIAPVTDVVSTGTTGTSSAPADSITTTKAKTIIFTGFGTNSGTTATLNANGVIDDGPRIATGPTIAAAHRLEQATGTYVTTYGTSGSVSWATEAFSLVVTGIELPASGQAQATIIIPVSQRFAQGQAQADIKAINQGFGQAQADIKAVGRGFAQAQADIKATGFGFAQSQADIKATSYGFGQANVDIKAVSYRFAQAQADIKATSFAFAQSNADIKAKSNGFAQAQADILQTYPNPITTVASDSFTRVTSNAWGTADVGGAWTMAGTAANIATTGTVGTFTHTVANTVLSGRLASIRQQDQDITFQVATDKLAAGGSQTTQVYCRYVDSTNYYRVSLLFRTDQAIQISLVPIIANVLGTSLGSSVTTLTHIANQLYNVRIQLFGGFPTTGRVKVWQDGTTEPSAWEFTGTDSSAVLQVPGQIAIITSTSSATTNLPVTYSIDNLNLSAVQLGAWGQAQARIIVRGITGFGQAQVDIKATSLGFGQAQADILAVGYGFGQAQTDIKAIGYAFGQAQVYISTQQTFGFGQAQASVKQTYQGYGQAQCYVGTSGLAFAQAQADILHTYQRFGQSQADIKATTQQYGQAQVDILATSQAYGQAQVDILHTTQQYGQAQVDILATSRAYAQAQADIKATGYGFGQAQADIKATNQAYAQAQALIAHTSFGFGQSQVTIKAVTSQSGQAQANVKTTYTASGQAQADVRATTYAFGQAQVYVSTQSYGFGQAQTSVKTTVNAYAQAQSHIKTTALHSGNAQATIKTTVTNTGQATALIVTRNNAFGQAQAILVATTTKVGQAQAQIVLTGINAFGQSQAFISKSAGYGQAAAYIFQTHTLKTLVVSDRSLGLGISDRETDTALGTDVSLSLTLTDRNLTLTLLDRIMTLGLRDEDY